MECVLRDLSYYHYQHMRQTETKTDLFWSTHISTGNYVGSAESSKVY